MKITIAFLLMLISTVSFSSEFFSLKDKTFQGKDYDFSSNKGKVTLIVNIASRCGYTPQLDGLQKLLKNINQKT